MKLDSLATSILLACAFGGCGATATVAPASLGAGSLPEDLGGSAGSYSTQYVQLVIFENESYGDVIGSSQAPYITSLAKTWANMTDSHAITHPSEPNYLALFSGSTHGVTGDNCPVTFKTASLGSELIEAGLTFTGYAESMPRNGFEGCQAHPDHLPSGYLYMRKHVPWPDFTKVPRKNSIVYRRPLDEPPSRFVWITPNMCNDMHDCSIGTGDTWASENLPSLIAWDAANDGILILTFDENDGGPGNQIPTILAGNVNPGQYGQNINHYNVLRTIEDIFGVKPLGNAGSATPIQGVVR
jgi:phosphatidylinositol-3-phosphatase